MPAGASGGISGVKFGTPTTPIAPTSLYGNPATFTAAANTQASDYDTIMKNYAQIANANPINVAPVSYNPITAAQATAPAAISAQQIASSAPVSAAQLTPQTANYEQSGDVTSSLADLSNLVNTGGYSDADIANIRARDISPIRSIYANAQQNVERQKALSGGYSPNFNAVQSKLARDEANQVGDVNTAANAGIAQNVASNKIAAAPSYASAAASANAAQAQADQANAAIINSINATNASNALNAGEFNTTTQNAINQANVGNQLQAGEFNTQAGMNTNQFNTTNANQANEFNTQGALNAGQFNTTTALNAAQANKDTALKATQGQASLYGTTPALTNMFGNQVASAANINQGQQQLNNQRLGTIGSLARFGSS